MATVGVDDGSLQADSQPKSDRQTNTETHRQRDRETYKQTDRQRVIKVTYLASSVSAHTAAASGALADVPVCLSVQL